MRGAGVMDMWHDQVHRTTLSEAGCANPGRRTASMACSVPDFWFINSCEALTRQFRCERGCAVEAGRDIPNYVLDPALHTFQTCLVSQDQPSCDARHTSTARLCACV